MTPARGAWVDVDLGAVSENTRRLKAFTPSGCAFMAVVKADGYGHGAVRVSQAALGAGADALGVATVEEARELRDAGIAAPVLLLAEPPPDAAGEVVSLDVATALFTRELAIALSQEASRIGRVARFHLKVDTGMNRIGVRAEDAAEFLTSLKGLPGLALEGVFTHFATAELHGDWDFERQMQRFAEALEGIERAGFEPGTVHAANSAGTVLHPEAHFDMVRCGIAVYGLHPAETTREHVELEPAMSVRARIAHVKDVPMGEGVSYGFTWRAPAPTRVATIPLGYGDGLHRLLSDRMRVLIGGAHCPQIGRVCMDQFMVEVAQGLSATAGDEVVLVGTQGARRIEMDELARGAETINYELACGFALRLERRYG